MHYIDIKKQEKVTKHRFNELMQQGIRLIEFWGNEPLSHIKGATCREFAVQSSTDSMARHDLEIFRAAVNLYDREFGLDHVPKFTLPAKGKSRTGWLTRNQAARLLWTAHRAGKPHLVRFILIGLYTGTRMTPILNLQWFPNTSGGYVDLEKQVMYREAPGTKRTNKRKPPVAIPYRLLPHLRRWHKMDTSGNGTIRHIVHFNAAGVSSLRRAWDTNRRDAGLDQWANRHCLRHTSITWAMQSGKISPVEAQGFFGISQKVMEDVYLHHHVDFQANIRKVF
jgi:integrase